jgi:hypothetical protein
MSLGEGGARGGQAARIWPSLSTSGVPKSGHPSLNTVFYQSNLQMLSSPIMIGLHPWEFLLVSLSSLYEVSMLLNIIKFMYQYY